MNYVNRQILRLSVPAIVSNITVPLLGLCDTAISGHLGSELYLAAIAVGSVMLNVVVWLFGFLRMGTTGLTANAFGAGDDDGVKKIFTQSLLIALAAGAFLILFQIPLFDLLSGLIGAQEDVNENVREYFMIRIWGAPALLGVMAVSGWFVGMQSTFYPMIIAIGVNVINIVASFLLVFSCGIGFSGVAWGTLISNWAGLGIAIICVVIMRRGKGMWCPLRDVIQKAGLKRFFSVNSNLFFRSACIIAVTMGVTAAGARLGALTLAVNVVIMQFFQFFSFFMDGFAFSGEALIGRWAGAGDKEMLHKFFKALLCWTLSMAIVFSLAYGLGSGAVADLLSDSENVRQGVTDMNIWISLIPIVSAWAFIYDGFFVGITDTRRMMIATILASAIFFVVAFIRLGKGGIFIDVGSNRMIWIAFLSYLLMRGVVLALLWKSSLGRYFKFN